MTSPHPSTGYVLFAHGSRDPAWRKPIESVAAAIRAAQPEAVVACAYLELCEPDLPTALDSLVTAGAQHIRVLPVFFGMGKHAREDLPLLIAAWRALHPDVSVEVLAPAGEHPALAELLARMTIGTL